MKSLVRYAIIYIVKDRRELKREVNRRRKLKSSLNTNREGKAMLKEIRKKVMQIANRLHYKSGLDRSTALVKAWRLIRTHAVSTRVAGTSFDNRQNVLFLKSYQPEQISIKLVRDRQNTFDTNAVAVVAAVKGKVSAVIGYLPKAVASVVAVIIDKGLNILSDTLSIVGGYAGHENYGARIVIRI